jgi:hypothetical protein
VQLAQVCRQSRPIEACDGLQGQPATGPHDDAEFIAFLQAGLPQAIGGQAQRQAVAPAANRLLEVPTGRF